MLAGLGGIALWMEGYVDNPPVRGGEEVSRAHFLTAEAKEKGEYTAYAPGPDDLGEVMGARAIVGVGEGLAACLETERDAASVGWAADLVLPKGRGARRSRDHVRREPCGASIQLWFAANLRKASALGAECSADAAKPRETSVRRKEARKEGGEGVGEDVHWTVCPVIRRECSEVS